VRVGLNVDAALLLDALPGDALAETEQLDEYVPAKAKYCANPGPKSADIEVIVH